MALALSVFLFAAVASLVFLFGYRRYVVAGQAYETIGGKTTAVADAIDTGTSRSARLAKMASRLAGKIPASEKTAAGLRQRLTAAGYRDRNAVSVAYGAKLITMCFMGVALAALGSGAAPAARILGILIGVFAGFRLPDYILAKRMNQRQKRLRKGLPDALDLIIVCAEAGLTIDRAFRNVTHHLALVHKDLSDELGLVTAEIGAGLRRREALDNLVLRTQETEIRKFVAVIAQADRFGTSMGDALRTHADYLRVRRRQDAEERASKVGVLLIFPIFVFIMPCMLLVSVGPAAFVVAKQLLPALSGTAK